MTSENQKTINQKKLTLEILEEIKLFVIHGQKIPEEHIQNLKDSQYGTYIKHKTKKTLSKILTWWNKKTMR